MASRAPPYAKLLKRLPPHEIMHGVAHGSLTPMADLREAEHAVHGPPDWPAEVESLAEQCVDPEAISRPSFDEMTVELRMLLLALPGADVDAAAATAAAAATSCGASEATAARCANDGVDAAGFVPRSPSGKLRLAGRAKTPAHQPAPHTPPQVNRPRSF